MHLFYITLTTNGDAASYQRDVMVVAESAEKARQRINEYFTQVGEIIITKSCPTYNDYIFPCYND